ncbi:GNAT family N-acetyltransferase [Mucilaginibacter sp. RS28]|uniref:GNAT family N-acetyltransferase n=1 Tax=Mucilaginibacter straminoryzae TaxID=2932774 RepID=A0A9X1X4P9_9SPHI|nr:GNAT family N-acetyltransferase [Mucilaginibacter straminoryzae]MCJ8210969.1 GNAT family N-acetyltransferase [Mucilaginibacter straminoryzae]
MLWYREAQLKDIPQLMRVRLAVRENTLSDPNLVTPADCEEYLTNRGKGWVYIEDSEVVGFGIADLTGRNIWALFVHPNFEGQGIGKELHRLMLNWYFAQTTETIWLSTAFNTRAEQFYRRQGWADKGPHNAKELKFEMSFEDWKRLASHS